MPTLIGTRETPEEVKTALEAIDPSAELIHLGGKRWWLGIRAPNPKAADPMELEGAYNAVSRKSSIPDRAEAAAMDVELEKELTMRQIMAAGFRPVALYTVERGELGTIVEDFRLRDHNWKTKTPKQIEKELKESISLDVLNRKRIEEWGKMASEAAQDAWRYVFKRARSVLVGAFNRRM